MIYNCFHGEVEINDSEQLGPFFLLVSCVIFTSSNVLYSAKVLERDEDLLKKHKIILTNSSIENEEQSIIITIYPDKILPNRETKLGSFALVFLDADTIKPFDFHYQFTAMPPMIYNDKLDITYL